MGNSRIQFLEHSIHEIQAYPTALAIATNPITGWKRSLMLFQGFNAFKNSKVKIFPELSRFLGSGIPKNTMIEIGTVKAAKKKLTKRHPRNFVTKPPKGYPIIGASNTGNC